MPRLARLSPFWTRAEIHGNVALLFVGEPLFSHLFLPETAEATNSSSSGSGSPDTTVRYSAASVGGAGVSQARPNSPVSTSIV